MYFHCSAAVFTVDDQLSRHGREITQIYKKTHQDLELPPTVRSAPKTSEATATCHRSAKPTRTRVIPYWADVEVVLSSSVAVMVPSMTWVARSVSRWWWRA